MVLIHSRAKRIHGQVIASVAAIVALALLAACENPLAQMVETLQEETLSPRIAVIAPGDASLSAGGEYDFGDVCVGNASTACLRLRNDGRRSLVIDTGRSGMTLSSGAAAGTFSGPASLPATLEPGQSVELSYAYAPTDSAERSADVVIATNDLVNPSFSFTLRGKGFSIGFDAPSVSGVSTTAATCVGGITDDYGSSITQRGVCWSTEPYPTTSDDKAIDGGVGTGSFSCVLSGLSAGRSYYVRSFAVNALGVGYSQQAYFSAIPSSPAAPTVAPVPYAAGSGKLYVSWSAVPGSAIAYDVYYDIGGVRPATPNGPTGVTITSCTIPGLVNYTDYTVWIAARNASGSGEPSPGATATVGVRVEAISLGKSAATFLPGSSEAISATVTPETATNPGITWSTSNGTVATVSDGVVTGGVSAGTATITAAAVDGQGAEETFTATTIAFSAGATGPAGGKLFYDKGAYSDGWRYMEVSPAYVTVGSGQSWCTSAWYSDSMPGAGGVVVGTGQANTDAIISACGDGGYWARACRDYGLGGYADWFLPSKDEVSEMRTRLPGTEFVHGYGVVSSSEYNYDRSWAFSSQYSDWNQTWKSYIGSGYVAWPVRRF